MGETQFTPGPWLIDAAETKVRWPVIYAEDQSYEEGKNQIAEVSKHVAKNYGNSIKTRWRKHADCDEAQGNANLIAAAPDLYAVLSLLVSDLDSYKANPHGHSPLHHVSDAIEALKKARGE